MFKVSPNLNPISTTTDPSRMGSLYFRKRDHLFIPRSWEMIFGKRYSFFRSFLSLGGGGETPLYQREKAPKFSPEKKPSDLVGKKKKRFFSRVNAWSEPFQERGGGFE